MRAAESSQSQGPVVNETMIGASGREGMSAHADANWARPGFDSTSDNGLWCVAHGQNPSCQG